MTTLDWLEILLFVLVGAWTGGYALGWAMAREQFDQRERVAAMRRHPSNHLRSVP